MRQIYLTEWEDKSEVELTVEERDQIKKALPEAVIEPQSGKENMFQINPQNYVGVIRTADLVIEIKPKLPIDSVLFLVAYALDPKYWSDQQIGQFKSAPNLQEAIAVPFIDFVEKAFKKGQLYGYKEVDESLHRVKGKVRFADQLKRHQRVTIPIEVTYDELTVDIEENRRILAAANKLLRLSRLSEKTKRSLRRIIRQLEFSEVTHCRYDRRSIKPIQVSRLNQHYERPLALAKLILSNETIELYGESIHSTGLLFRMSEVFEKFVRVALREALNLSEQEFPEKTKNLYLAEDEKLEVAPDLSWWRQGKCVLVGDVKYKQTNPSGKRPDLYQLLSFAVAANVDKGFLIYAAGEVDNLSYQIRGVGKELIVETLELSGDPASILAEVEALAIKLRKACFHQSSNLEEAHLLGV